MNEFKKMYTEMLSCMNGERLGSELGTLLIMRESVTRDKDTVIQQLLEYAWDALVDEVLVRFMEQSLEPLQR